MQERDLEFFDRLVKGYFGNCDAQIRIYGDKNSYDVINVKFHTQDKKWLKSYIFNKVYNDFDATSVLHKKCGGIEYGERKSIF